MITTNQFLSYIPDEALPLPILFVTEEGGLADWEPCQGYQTCVSSKIAEVAIYKNRWYDDFYDFLEVWLDHYWDEYCDQYCFPKLHQDEIYEKLIAEAEDIWNDHCRKCLLVYTDYEEKPLGIDISF